MRQEFLSFPRSANLFLVNQFLIAGFYTWPFWFGFASERISASQFGIFIAVIYIVGLVAEVPTGAFADSFGRKRSAILGALLEVGVPLLVFVGGNFPAYMCAAVVGGLASAFLSGSLESLMYELPDMTPKIYRRVMMQEAFFFQSGLIVSSALGGFMYSVNHFWPFGMQMLSFVAAAVVVGFIQPDVQKRSRVSKERQRNRLANYIRTNKEGFLHLFRTRAIWSLITFGAVLGAIQWLSIEYVNEAAMIHYGIDPEFRGLLIAGAKMLVLLLFNTLIFRRLKTDRHKLTYLVCVATVVFVLYSLGIRELFLIAFVGFSMVSAVRDTFIRPIIHDHIEDRWRATAISSYSFVSNLLLGLSSLVIGVALQQRGVVFVQRVFLVLIVVVVVPAFLRYVPRLRKNETHGDMMEQ